MWRPAAVLVIVTVLGIECGTAVLSAQRPQPFPNARSLGRATVEYRDRAIRAIAGYDYSQRNHEGPWLLIDLAMTTRRRVVIHRDQISLVTPAGETVKVASQQQVLSDAPGIQSLLQNAAVLRRDQSLNFMPSLEREPMRFYAFPAGSHTVHNDVVVDPDRIAVGELLFEAPAGQWAPGVYRLVIDREHAHATIPIILQPPQP
jgi:hypothetical protein